jgi:hypothetical protein
MIASVFDSSAVSIHRTNRRFESIFLCRQMVDSATCFLSRLGGLCDMFHGITGGLCDMFSNPLIIIYLSKRAILSPKNNYAKKLFSNHSETKDGRSPCCLKKNQLKRQSSWINDADKFQKLHKKEKIVRMVDENFFRTREHSVPQKLTRQVYLEGVVQRVTLQVDGIEPVFRLAEPAFSPQ